MANEIQATGTTSGRPPLWIPALIMLTVFGGIYLSMPVSKNVGYYSVNYDAQGNVIQRTNYDAKGNITSESVQGYKDKQPIEIHLLKSP